VSPTVTSVERRERLPILSASPLSVSHADYFGSPGLSWSVLREMANSPLHFRKRREQPIPDSDTLRLGRATHTAVLEPHRFLADYVLWEGGRRAGKVWEEFTAVAEAAGKTVLTDDQYTAALEMRDAVRSHPVAAPYLEAGIAERPIYWTDSDTGIACRARPDLISTSKPAVVELKTARSTDARLFGNSAAHLSYHGQLAFYVDGMAAQPGFGVLPAVIIAVEKDSLDVSVFTVDAEDALYAGQALYRELLAKVAACEASGKWPGRCEREIALQLPAWSYPEDDGIDGLTFGEGSK
jgi:exodeoxyribonuclease VIII